METIFERWLLGARWILLPLYLALLVSVLGIYVTIARELVHIVAVLPTATDAEIILALLTVLDLVLLANLIVMVAVSSYESYISRISASAGVDPPEWLGKLDSSNVKVKVAISIVLISAINLLRLFMMEATGERIVILAGVHLVFVTSALAIAVIDRIGRATH
jgi:uncharacterized protein (TIGR00645 family)